MMDHFGGKSQTFHYFYLYNIYKLINQVNHEKKKLY
jgi:hypothetical protein